MIDKPSTMPCNKWEKNRQNEEAKRRDVVHIFVRRKKTKIEKG